MQASTSLYLLIFLTNQCLLLERPALTGDGVCGFFTGYKSSVSPIISQNTSQVLTDKHFYSRHPEIPVPFQPLR